MRQLARLAGARFVGGIVLYTGSQVLSLGGKIRAVPIDALWRTPTL
jgi:hypothetical protein